MEVACVLWNVFIPLQLKNLDALCGVWYSIRSWKLLSAPYLGLQKEHKLVFMTV